MNLVKKWAVVLTLASTALALPATSASAQSCSGPACAASAPTGSACRVFFSSDTGSGTYAPGQSDEPAGCYDPGQVYGLQGWHFHGPDGRRLSRAGVTQSERGLEFNFTDGDGGEPAQGYAWLVPLPAGTEPLSVSASGCAGICRMSLGPIPANATFVLLGFEFERTGGDGPIQTMAIGPLLRSATGVGALTVDFRDVEFAYRVNIRYALVLSSEVTGPNSTGGSYSGGGAALVGLSNAGNAILSGFSFHFQNGSHTLEDVGLELGGFGYEAWFQDHEEEANRRHPTHPFDWQADYVILN